MHDIVHELTIEAPPEAVFTAITTADGLASWWTTDATADPELGGTATFGFDDGATRLTMRIDAIDAPELVHWNCAYQEALGIAECTSTHDEVASVGSAAKKKK